jgi:membrane AbrB-like protein
MIRAAGAWSALAAATVAAGLALDAAGVPSAALFAALLVGLAAALAWPRAPTMPGTVAGAAQALLGVALGTYLHASSLQAVAGAWPAVTLVCAATLALCVLAGAVLARTTELDGPTAALGMVAGGASGIVAMADDLGGDDRLVAFMQYARVLVIVLVTPVLAGVLFGGDQGGGPQPDPGPLLGDLAGWGLTTGCALAGVALAAAVRLPAGRLLGPMVLAGGLTLSGAAGDTTVPLLLRDASFVVIGLQVGLRFTPGTIRQVGRLLGPVLASIVGLMAACFMLAVGLDVTTDVTLEDAYLATTPGGLYAVLAVAFGAGADTTFILAVQGLRLLVMVLLAPLVVRWTLRRPAADQA